MAKFVEVVVGARSGKLTVIEVFRGPAAWQVKVRCECGNEKVMLKSNFTKGNARSCGCVPPGAAFEPKHGLAGTNSYNTWKKMMARCYNPADQDFRHYGARGIKVCERWQNVENFVADMGERAKGMSIERRDVNGNYEPSNCVWLPHGERPKNRTKWQHTEEGRKAISDSRKKDWKEGVYASKVEAQQKH
jgi:hypothetical protein